MFNGCSSTCAYLQVLGGKQSSAYAEYIDMVTSGMLEARKHVVAVETLMHIMTLSSNYPAFK